MRYTIAALELRRAHTSVAVLHHHREIYFARDVGEAGMDLNRKGLRHSLILMKLIVQGYHNNRNVSSQPLRRCRITENGMSLSTTLPKVSERLHARRKVKEAMVASMPV